MNPIAIPMIELKPALAGLGKIITKRQTLPVLGCVRIERTRTGNIELVYRFSINETYAWEAIFCGHGLLLQGRRWP